MNVPMMNSRNECAADDWRSDENANLKKLSCATIVDRTGSNRRVDWNTTKDGGANKKRLAKDCSEWSVSQTEFQTRFVALQYRSEIDAYGYGWNGHRPPTNNIRKPLEMMWWANNHVQAFSFAQTLCYSSRIIVFEVISIEREWWSRTTCNKNDDDCYEASCIQPTTTISRLLQHIEIIHLMELNKLTVFILSLVLMMFVYVSQTRRQEELPTMCNKACTSVSQVSWSASEKRQTNAISEWWIPFEMKPKEKKRKKKTVSRMETHLMMLLSRQSIQHYSKTNIYVCG
jgi:hypothetical protein